MNPETDFSKLVDSYAKFILDGMDHKTLEIFAFDTLVKNLTKDHESSEELAEEIREQYDEEILQNLLS